MSVVIRHSASGVQEYLRRRSSDRRLRARQRRGGGGGGTVGRWVVLVQVPYVLVDGWRCLLVPFSLSCFLRVLAWIGKVKFVRVYGSNSSQWNLIEISSKSLRGCELFKSEPASQTPTMTHTLPEMMPANVRISISSCRRVQSLNLILQIFKKLADTR